MPHPNKTPVQHAPDHYCIDDGCIGCNLCVVLAPDHFRENLALETEADSIYILRQPETEAELSVCREAVRLCPVDAIKGVPS